MRIIIAGSRKHTPTDSAISEALSQNDWHCTTVVCGMAIGADMAGRRWANSRNIEVDCYPPDWDRYGKAAGFKRNIQMANNADALLAFWDGSSRGTKHMIDTARRKGLKVSVQRV